ncbi:hypothetical protein [uncultured Paraglaciecola sp.]|uniref:portal protein n=1 Tax=uncultured Paraglaciecola sp. TaxID=1765024 RepID=UPI00260A5359|nr:hypothetical protein [uncultured Paraglaciecola sp.]
MIDNGQRTDINTVDFKELPRVQQCKKIRDDFKSRYENWVQLAKQSNTYLRGTHFHGALANDNRVDPDDYLPEDRHARGSNEKIYPSIGYSLDLIDQMTQYIQQDQGDIIVSAEGQYAFPTIDPRLAQLVDVDSQISQNELIAKMLTARIDLFSERSGVARKLDEVAHEAAANRTAFVVVDWIDDETNEEPVDTKLIRAGSYWFDPTASCIDESQYIGYICGMDKDSAGRKYGKEITNTQKTRIDLNHCYTRDYTVKELPKGVAQAEGVESVVYKYPSAWRYTVYHGSQILYDGPMTTPTGRPPICIFTWRSLPRSMIGVSVLDSTKTINNNVDRIVQYIMETAYRSLGKTSVDKAQVDDLNVLDENYANPFLFFDSTKAKSSTRPFEYIQGGQIPDSLYAILDKLMALGKQMCGADGIDAQDLSKFTSGDAIEGLVQNDREGIASRVKDEFYLFLQDYFELVIRFIMQNEVEEVSLTIETPAGEAELTTSMDLYQFDDDDFERYFDVSVYNPKNMPSNPVKRNAFLLSLVDNLGARDIDSAKLFLDIADLPYKSSFKDYIDAKEQEALLAQQAQAAQDTDAAEALAQSKLKEKETREKMASDTAKSVADGIEALAKDISATEPDRAAQLLLTIPQEVNNAYNTVINGGQWTQQIPQIPQN